MLPDLHVISVLNNPRRFASRIRLIREFIPHMLDSGAKLTLVLHAFGDRPHEIAEDDSILRHVNVVRVRGGADHELWIKEALIKIGVRSLPQDWKLMCWADADVRHERPDWVEETKHMLQHYRVGQTWSHSIDLGPKRGVLTNEWGNDVDRSFCAAWMAGDVDMGEVREDYRGEGHTVVRAVSRALLANQGKRDHRQHYGYCWSIRREAWDGIGGLPDWLVTGSADFHSALAFAGKLSRSEAYISDGCTRRLREFARRCDEHIRQDIGCVPGLLMHGFHGPKRKRFYLSRKDILQESGFDPDTHLTYDWQGIPSLAGDNRILRDGLRRLAILRDEDSTEE